MNNDWQGKPWRIHGGQTLRDIEDELIEKEMNSCMMQLIPFLQKHAEFDQWCAKNGRC